MSTKTKKPTKAAPKKDTKAKALKSAPAKSAPAAKASMKASSKSSKKEINAPQVNMIVTETMESDEMLEIVSSSEPSMPPMTLTEGAGGAIPKNFRTHPDIENFYRFLHENDLRVEALQIIDELVEARAAKKKTGKAAVAN